MWRRSLKGSGDAWKVVELTQFVKQHFTLASVAPLFGTKVLEHELEDGMYDWL
jgi:hypothetical protein